MNPVQTYVDTFNGTGGALQSGSITFSFAITQAFEAYIPITVITPAAVSCGAEVYIYRSCSGDSGPWETENEGSFVGAFPLDNSATMRKDIHVETGQYLVRVLVGGGSAASYSARLDTAYVITAYE